MTLMVMTCFTRGRQDQLIQSQSECVLKLVLTKYLLLSLSKLSFTFAHNVIKFEAWFRRHTPPKLLTKFKFLVGGMNIPQPRVERYKWMSERKLDIIIFGECYHYQPKPWWSMFVGGVTYASLSLLCPSIETYKSRISLPQVVFSLIEAYTSSHILLPSPHNLWRFSRMREKDLFL